MKIITITGNIKEVYDYFYKAELELKNKNRFYNEKLDKILEFIFSCEANEKTIKKGNILYRARIYDNPDAEMHIWRKLNNFIFCVRPHSL